MDFDLDFDDEIIEDDIDFNILDNDVLQNFPFLEDDFDSLTDYELISKTYEYLDDKKANKEDIPNLDDYYNKGEVDSLLDEKANITDIPDVSNFITKDVNDLTYYTKSSDLSSVATSGSYTDLSNKPTIPDVSNFITKDVNDLTYYTKSSDLSSVATSGSYTDLSNKPTIPDVSNFITKDVNDLTYYTKSSDLSSVATSGSYTDLSNKPTIPVVSTVDLNSVLVNSWENNGQVIAGKIGTVKFVQMIVRSGTAVNVITNFPSDYRPSANTILPAQSYSAVGYAIIKTNGTLEVSSSLLNSNVMLGGLYI